MDRALQRDVEGVAAIAIGTCEMSGYSDDDVFVTIGHHMEQLGILTRENALLVAEASRCFPQPQDEDAEERERRRPIEEMLGVTSPEDQLAAVLRAREQALRLAEKL